MIADFADVVGEHIPLVVQHFPQGTVAGAILKGDVGQAVDHRRNHHEENNAQPNGAPRPSSVVGGGFPVSALGKETREKDHCQSHPGVHPRPLAGDAQTHAHTAQQQGPRGGFQAFVIGGQEHVLVHKQVHGDDIEGNIYIDCCDAGLDKVHEIEGQQPAPQNGQRGTAGHALAEHIHERQHGDAEQGAHNAPAEGVHAEDQDAHADEQLAQRRVGVFVAVQPVEHFIGAAGVVDFVKVHSVAEAQPQGQGILLVKQAGEQAAVFRQKPVAVFIHENQLHHRHLPVKQQGNHQLAALHIPLVQAGGLPCEDLTKADILLMEVVLGVIQR